MKRKTHLCLLGDARIANLTPLLDKETAPEEVVLVFYPAQEAEREDFEQVLSRYGITIIHLPIPSPYNYASTLQEIRKYLNERNDTSIVLNASGGTKAMTLAATDAFREKNLPIFYVEHEIDQLLWLQGGEGDFDLQDRISLKNYLLAYGVEVESVVKASAVRKGLKKLTKDILKNIDGYGKALGTLNYLANSPKKENGRYIVKLSSAQQKDENFNLLLQRIAREGVIEIQEDSFIIADEEIRFFLNGGWLETYFLGVIQELKHELGIREVLQGLIVKKKGTDITNEIDIAFLHNNNLFLIECKTSRFAQVEHDESPGSEMLYKLDTLGNVLGSCNGRMMLASYREISQYDIQRAKDLQIEICVASELQELSAKIKKWILNKKIE